MADSKHHQNRLAARAALVTPPGTGGVAVIQVCGPQAWVCARPYLRDKRGQPAGLEPPLGPRLLQWCDGDEVLDEVLVAVRVQPDGPVMVTVCAHAGLRIVERLLETLARSGAHLVDVLGIEETWPSLAPIEASLMHHLPQCQTSRVAGWLVEQAEALPCGLQACLQQIEVHDIQGASRQIASLLETYEPARRLIAGASVVVVGPPNAGKSTLANRLFDRPWSQESPLIGTTRDWVQQPIAIEGLALRVADTAGLRETADPLERAAQEHNRPLIDSADLRVLVLDLAVEPQLTITPELAGRIGGCVRLVVLNKLDLVPPAAREERGAAWLRALERAPIFRDCKSVAVSARSGAGIDDLRSLIAESLLTGTGFPKPAIWDPQHRDLLRLAHRSLPGNPLAAREFLLRMMIRP